MTTQGLVDFTKNTASGTWKQADEKILNKVHIWIPLYVCVLIGYSVYVKDSQTASILVELLKWLFGTVGIVHGGKEIARTLKGNGNGSGDPAAH